MSAHGTLTSYTGGCKCDACRETKNRYERQRRKYRAVYGITLAIDATGTIRRIRALMAMGWSSRDIARCAGWTTGEAVLEIAKRGWVERKTVATIRRVYDELSMTHGPSTLTRNRARRNGWAPPLAWDEGTIDDPAATPDMGGTDDTIDTVAVERAMSGRRVTLTLAERVEVIRRLAAQGWSDAQVAEVLDVTDRTVTRIRADHQIPSTWSAAA